MKTRLLPVILATGLAAALFGAGCSTLPKRNPKSTQTVVLSPGRAQPDVTIDPVTAVTIVLPGPDPGSGYVWEIASNNNRVLEQMGPLAVSTGGSGVSTSVTFYGLETGRSVLRFFLVRANEAVTVPVAKCVLTVRVAE